MALDPKHQKKWDSLQDRGQSSIDHILAGKATDADIKSLSKLLNEQHELAGQIFDENVENAKSTADAIVDKLNEERIKAGKRALTQKAFERVFQATFQQVMSQAIEDILGMVHDEFENQQEEIKTKVFDALDKIRNFHAPVEEAKEKSKIDRLVEEKKAEDTVQLAEQAPRSPIDKALGTQSRTADQQRTEVMQAIKDTASAVKDKVGLLYTKLTGNSSDDEDKKASIWTRKLDGLLKPFLWAKKKKQEYSSIVGKLFDYIGKPLLFAIMNPQLIKNITDAVSEYLSFDKIGDYIDRSWKALKDVGSDSIDWIIDKVADLIGWKREKKKTTPVDKALKKPDTVAQAANAPAQVLDSRITQADAARDLPRQQQGLQQAQKTLADAQAKYKASPTPANKKALDDAQRNVNYWQLRVNQYTQRAGTAVGAPTASPNGLPTTVPGSTPAAGGQTPAAGGTAPTESSAPQSTGTSVPTTAVLSDLPVMTPGKSYEPPVEQAAPVPENKSADTASPRIGLGSFGYDSGDAGLNILNMGMIS